VVIPLIGFFLWLVVLVVERLSAGFAYDTSGGCAISAGKESVAISLRIREVFSAGEIYRHTLLAFAWSFRLDPACGASSSLRGGCVDASMLLDKFFCLMGTALPYNKAAPLHGVSTQSASPLACAADRRYIGFLLPRNICNEICRPLINKLGLTRSGVC
jgi:hypothetical protein